MNPLRGTLTADASGFVSAPAPSEDPIVRCPSHTKHAFDVSTLPLVVRWAEEQILKLQADAIACCGHSGLLVAGAVSYLTRIPVFAVRKPGEECRAGCSGPVSAIAPNGKARRWVWLDDFISMGGTFTQSTQQLWNQGLIEKPYPVASVEYESWIDKKERRIQHGYWRLPDYIKDYDWSQAPQTIPVIGRHPI